MNLIKSFKNFYLSVKERNIIIIVSAIYNFIWGICKIVFGVFNYTYYFCISGASTLLFGFIKQVYLKNFSSESQDDKRIKSITVSVLLIISSALFAFYMARLFFVSEEKIYGKIMSITIATFSFAELGLSIYEYTKAIKTNDVLKQTFKGCSLASSCAAMVLTQVALLSATNTPGNLYNAITGTVFGMLMILIGVYLLINAIQQKRPKNDLNDADV